jgi:transposase
MRETSDAMDDLFGLPIRTGSVVTSCERVCAALEPVYEAVKQALPRQPVANVDEWKQENQRHWLWTFVTPIATLFHINRSRGGKV